MERRAHIDNDNRGTGGGVHQTVHWLLCEQMTTLAVASPQLLNDTGLLQLPVSVGPWVPTAPSDVFLNAARVQPLHWNFCDPVLGVDDSLTFSAMTRQNVTETNDTSYRRGSLLGRRAWVLPGTISS